MYCKIMEEMNHHHHCDCHGEHDDHHHCDCHGEHEHHHEEGNLKSKLIQIAVTVILLVVAVFIEKEYDLATWQLLLVYLAPPFQPLHDGRQSASPFSLHLRP